MPRKDRTPMSPMARLHQLLEPGRGRINLVSWFIIALVLASLVSLAIETEITRTDTPIVAPARDQMLLIVTWVNSIVVWAFAAEFILRFASEGENPRHRGAAGRLRFLFTPIAIADFLAFGPELIVMLAFPNVDAVWLAALRALRLFRLFKLARYVPAFGIVGAAVKRASGPLLAALCVAAAQVYVAALMLYFIERDNDARAFGSITRALWWSVVTLTTVGYGDSYPHSALGRVAAGLVAVAGIGIVAMPTGILASAFAEEFRERHEARLKAQAQIVEKDGEDI
jgi:voltage-gated potassium channel